jgi:hypothetical protein
MCRYQEGGKRGLPIAYMASLETRLQDTEAALYSTLRALHDQRGITSEPLEIETDALPTQNHLRSKAEKQHDWKQRPLRTSENIVAWFGGEQQRHTATNSTLCNAIPTTSTLAEIHSVADTLTIPTEFSSRAEEISAPARPVSTTPNNIIERLRNCKPPITPNTWRPETGTTAWTNNYF